MKSMIYYASHYLWHAGQNRLFRMQRIGLEASSHHFVSMEPLEEEVRQTQWLGGLVVLAPCQPEVREGEPFPHFCLRVSQSVTGGESLYAFHVTGFDLQAMKFTSKSRLVRL